MSGREDVLRRACDLFATGDHEGAVAACRRLTQREPRYAEAHRQLALMLAAQGHFDAAIFAARRAAELAPTRAEMLQTLGGALARAGRHADAGAHLERAVGLDPSHSAAWADLGMVRLAERRHDEALEAFEAAIRAHPTDFAPRLNAAMMRLELADAAGAIESLKALRRELPAMPVIAQALASAMNYADGQDPGDVLAAHRAFGRMLDQPRPTFPNERKPEGPLRAAFLSPDFYDHSVASFLQPLLRHIDRAQFVTVGVYSGRTEDGTTRMLKGLFGQWIDAAGLPDEGVADRLRRARIDIAIDLCGLFLGHSLGALARGAAPVQATWLGYPNTTGVPAIGWRIVDAVTDPPGAEALATERLARLDPCFLCYEPPAEAPPVTFRDPGAPITFGSFNAVKKIAPGCVRLWSRVLIAVPASRMLLKGSGFSSRRARETILARFKENGITPDRVEIRLHAPGKNSHLAAYGDMDIALDTTPYNGTTTTCEALWMGVPVVALAGAVHASRVSATLLTAAGLPELIAPDGDRFVAMAAELAGNAARRAVLRRDLRASVAASALCDGASYARAFEGSLRDMWSAWCTQTA